VIQYSNSIKRQSLVIEDSAPNAVNGWIEDRKVKVDITLARKFGGSADLG